MKLLIAGSRSITDFELAPYIPSDTDTIISGGAAGVDGVAEGSDDENIRKIYKNPLPYSEKCCIIILGVLYPERGMVVLFEII